MSRSVVKIALVAATVATVSFAVILVNQSAQLVELAGRLHPAAGQLVLWALLVFYAACVVVPLVLWLRLPRSMVPPVSDQGPEFAAYVENLRARLRANPRLAGAPLDSLDHIHAALGELDAAANQVTKAAASRVFVSTAISQNGSLDALLVLGLQTRLVWDVARVYRQRPSLRDMAWLYANVLTTAFVAGEIEELDLADQVQPMVQNALGAAAGAVPGLQVASSVVVASLISGTANAFLTLRVGVVARRYCGSLVRPQKRGLRRAAFTEAAGMLGVIAAGGAKQVVGAIARASSRTVTSTVSGLGGKVKSAGNAVVDTLSFRRKGSES